jgi:hypothetical protein
MVHEVGLNEIIRNKECDKINFNLFINEPNTGNCLLSRLKRLINNLERI